MLAKRIIPCLDVDDGRVVKGVKFEGIKDAGDPVDLARRYNEQGADELTFLDIGASYKSRDTLMEVVRQVAREVFIPLCVGGGIRTVDDMRLAMNAGADKVSINTPALMRPDLINELAEAFGVQCVVVGIDSLRDQDGQWRVRQFTGDPDKTRALQKTTLEWVAEVQQRGAGEIVLNCMGSDGARNGYDIEQLSAVRAICKVPLVASKGAGLIEHFIDVFKKSDVDAALAATVFHNGSIPIPELKRALADKNIPVRL